MARSHWKTVKLGREVYFRVTGLPVVLWWLTEEREVATEEA